MADTIPDWASTAEKKKLWGKAKRLGADASVLGDEHATEGFVEEAHAQSAVPASHRDERAPNIQAAVFYLTDMTLVNSKLSKGIRGTVYRLASDNGARWNISKDLSIFYEGNNLVIRVCFPSMENFQRFANSLLDYLRLFSVEANIGSLNSVRLVDPPIILARDYCTKDENSDEYSLAITQFTAPSFHYGELDEATVCMMLERPDLADFLGLNCINCHLKSQTKYKETKDDPDNILFMSWRLHQRFDGLKVMGPKNIPQFALKYTGQTQETKTLSDGIERVKVTVDLEFPAGTRDSNSSEQIMVSVNETLKEGSKLDRDARVIHTFLWVQNVGNFKRFADFKYNETYALWKKGRSPGELIEDEGVAHRLRTEALKEAEALQGEEVDALQKEENA